MKILVDRNLSPRWVAVLSAAGISAAHWSSIGSANAPDKEIIARASDEGWVTLNDLLKKAVGLAIRGDEPDHKLLDLPVGK